MSKLKTAETLPGNMEEFCKNLIDDLDKINTSCENLILSCKSRVKKIKSAATKKVDDKNNE